MAGRKALDMLEERAERLIAQHGPDPLREAVERMTMAEIDHLTTLHTTHGPEAMMIAFQEIASK